MSPEAARPELTKLPTLEELKKSTGSGEQSSGASRESSISANSTADSVNSAEKGTQTSPDGATQDSLPELPSTPEDDLQTLQEIDWIGASRKRFNFGYHPDRRIESLLRRRLDLSRYDHLAPYPIRILVSMSFVVIACSAFWIIIWVVASLLDFNSFINELAYGMVFLLVAMFGFVIANPINLYNEQSIEKAGQILIDELKQEIDETTEDPENLNKLRKSD
ncbi:MAG: hypothetical protein HQM09_15780 [Candidatus Riflebacteria bacterium]|nr:hypothetical protein [Candidatus Riflebacteria bacterium]